MPALSQFDLLHRRTGTANKPVDVCFFATSLSTFRAAVSEKMSSAVVRSCSSGVCAWGRGEDRGKDNGTKLRRNLTSDEQISCTLWWGLWCVLVLSEITPILDDPGDHRSLWFPWVVHMEDTPEIFFSPFRSKLIFHYRLHVIQWLVECSQKFRFLCWVKQFQSAVQGFHCQSVLVIWNDFNSF